MKIGLFKKTLIVGVVFLFILVSVPTSLADTDTYSNAFVIIAGKSNTTYVESLWWNIGLYVPIVKRRFHIAANEEEGESITVLILSRTSGFAMYLDIEDISIFLFRARGIFYWGGKSLLFNQSGPSPIFAICRAATASITV